MKTTKIVIAGIGGVGGYFGALLAQAYADDPTIEICFFARGKNLEQIKTQGLTLITQGKTLVVKPDLATSSALEIGTADYIIVCTKNYDLVNIVEQLVPCIADHTVILPLLNGVEATPKIKKMIPNAEVVYGCTYLVSTIKSPGVIEETGNKRQIHFGTQGRINDRLLHLEHLLSKAGIEATASTNILSIIWQKFIFLSSLATATSYFDQPVGQLLAENKSALEAFVQEVAAVAKARNLDLPSDLVSRSIAHYESLPYDATSSMHRDFLQPNHPTELHSLTGYVVNQGEELNVNTPYFTKAFKHLQEKTN